MIQAAACVCLILTVSCAQYIDNVKFQQSNSNKESSNKESSNSINFSQQKGLGGLAPPFGENYQRKAEGVPAQAYPNQYTDNVKYQQSNSNKESSNKEASNSVNYIHQKGPGDLALPFGGNYQQREVDLPARAYPNQFIDNVKYQQSNSNKESSNKEASNSVNYSHQKGSGGLAPPFEENYQRKAEGVPAQAYPNQYMDNVKFQQSNSNKESSNKESSNSVNYNYQKGLGGSPPFPGNYRQRQEVVPVPTYPTLFGPDPQPNAYGPVRYQAIEVAPRLPAPYFNRPVQAQYYPIYGGALDNVKFSQSKQNKESSNKENSFNQAYESGKYYQ